MSYTVKYRSTFLIMWQKGGLDLSHIIVLLIMKRQHDIDVIDITS